MGYSRRSRAALQPKRPRYAKFSEGHVLSGLPNANAKSQRCSCVTCFPNLGRTPKGAYSSRGRSRHLLETAFSEPLLRTLLRTLLYCKTHSRPPSQNPSENPFPRTLPRTFSEPFLERCVAVRPLRRAPNNCYKPLCNATSNCQPRRK